MSANANELPLTEFVPDQGRSALFIACSVMLLFACVLALSVFLWTTYGVFAACVGLIVSFAGPITFYFLLKDRSTTVGRSISQTPTERLYVISFWSVCSLVLLMFAVITR